MTLEEKFDELIRQYERMPLTKHTSEGAILKALICNLCQQIAELRKSK
jgi:hypothetical protein